MRGKLNGRGKDWTCNRDPGVYSFGIYYYEQYGFAVEGLESLLYLKIILSIYLGNLDRFPIYINFK